MNNIEEIVTIQENMIMGLEQRLEALTKLYDIAMKRLETDEKTIESMGNLVHTIAKFIIE